MSDCNPVPLIPASKQAIKCREAQRNLPAPTFEQAKAQTDATQTGPAGPSGCVDGPTPRACDLNADGTHKETCQCEVCASRGKANSEKGKQGSRPEPFKPVNETLSSDGSMVSYDILEESAREIGIPATAAKYKVNVHALRSRARDKKWRKIPDGRTLAARAKLNGSELATTDGDLSANIPGFRARTFKKVDESIRKFSAKAPKNFRELDNAVKIGERMLGIGEETGARAQVLLQINEQIDAHDPATLPHEIEATVIEETVEQGSALPNEVEQGSINTSGAPALTQSDVSNETACGEAVASQTGGGIAALTP